MPHQHSTKNTPSKSELRPELRTIRDALRDRRTKSLDACTRALPHLSGLDCVAVYHAIASELDPTSLVAELRALGVAIAYPRVRANVGLLDFCVATENDLAPRTLGILEPKKHISPISLHAIDAFIVPALGFDPSGQRLGWGKGHYDQTLAQYPSATRIGICFQEQIIASLPATTNDQRMDIVVTDTERYQGKPRPARAPSREET